MYRVTSGEFEFDCCEEVDAIVLADDLKREFGQKAFVIDLKTGEQVYP